MSVIVPTFCEVENLPHLVGRLRAVFRAAGCRHEIIVVDDSSPDGTARWIEEQQDPALRLLLRSGRLGLSSAILDGLSAARGRHLVVMDADLSHPPEAIPAMLEALEGGADFAIGSRYVPGGTTDEEWSVYRRLNSLIATWLARPFAPVHDPLSGFFALDRATFERGRHFNAIGYKMGLELLVKCRCVHVREIPIHFEDRRYGKSKLSYIEQVKYLRHLRRLFMYKFSGWTHLVRFAWVGVAGTIINLMVFSVLLIAGAGVPAAAAFSILVSMAANVRLKGRAPGEAAPGLPTPAGAAKLFVAFLPGACLNLAVTVGVWRYVEGQWPPHAAALCGIAAGTALNYLVSRRLEWREEML